MAPRTQRLQHEISPFLHQHAQSPVDWAPWGEEARSRAERENKPLLLNIGYSASHASQALHRELTGNAEIAQRMNESFVCVLLDREEHPEFAEICRRASLALQGNAGWPLLVFLTPQAEPFFANTYLPPATRGARPDFKQLIEKIAELWSQDRAPLLAQAEQLTEHLRQDAQLKAPAGISSESLRLAYRQLERSFDSTWGGFGAAPKLPASSTLALLFRIERRTRDRKALTLALRTLDALATGGIYDQLGGGFAPMSLDESWTTHPFEKRLPDNAQLAEVYLEAYQLTGAPSYRRIARETLDFILREMQSPSGGFFSALGAASDGEEGGSSLFSHREVQQALGRTDAPRFCLFYGITPEGNYQGKNILTARRSFDSVAEELRISPEELELSLTRGREKLLELRQARVAPALDDTVLTSWNGLMIRALVRGAEVLQEPRYLQAAERSAQFILENLKRPDGGLYRAARAGQTRGFAYLEDYSYFADALLSLYEWSGEERWFKSCQELCTRILSDFSDEDGTAFYQTDNNQPHQLLRLREARDGALPGGNAVTCRLLARLAAHTGDESLRERALRCARAFGADLQRTPRAFPTLLAALDYLFEPPLQIVLVGDPETQEMEELRTALSSVFLPHRVLVQVPSAGSQLTQLTREKATSSEAALAYVCENFQSASPVDTPEALLDRLGQLERIRFSQKTHELGRKPIPGHATAQGTARYRTRHPLPAALQVEHQGLQLSRLSLGTRRLGVDDPAHRETLRSALQNGWQIIDTSPSFAFGNSERLVGEVLEELISSQALARDELFLVSKVGVALGRAAEQLARRSEAGQPLAWTTPLQTGGLLEEGSFSLDPVFLQEELQSSCERLGVEHLDAYLIQSPEHLLEAGRSTQEMEEALLASFQFFEAQVERGRLGQYGVFSNNWLTEDPARRVSLPRLLELAEQAGGAHHHFRWIELPLNWVERQALRGAPSEPSLVQTARAAGLFVLACRPLSALYQNAQLRLVAPHAGEDGAQAAWLPSARYKVASLEAEFETQFAPALRLAGQLDSGAALSLAGPLGNTLERCATLEQFEQAETTLITPRIRSWLQRLDLLHQGPELGSWQKFRQQYVIAVAAYLACLRQVLVEKNLAALGQLAQDLTDEPGFLPLPTHSESWFARSLTWLLQFPELSGLALGLRSLGQLQEATKELHSWGSSTSAAD